jgi:glycosyl transferase family 4
VSPSPREPLRVALLGGDRDAAGADVSELAGALRDAGHRSTLLPSAEVPALEAILRVRGFTGPLTPMPSLVSQLLAGEFDIAHAFSPPAALAALAWRRLTGGPVVFTWTEPVAREQLADKRLRLWLIRRATEDSDALVTPDEALRDELWRWLALEPTVIASGDATGHEHLYRGVMGRGGRG